MKPIRVLIVDDSVVIRRLLQECLESDPEIEVCGVAANGRIALARIPQLNPDLVTLDVEMPELDGLATMREIRAVHRRLPVIMFSTLTERGATATLDALAAGANDYVTKPANAGHVSVAMQRVRESLIPRIKALCGRTPTASAEGTPTAPAPRPAPRGRSKPAPVDLVAIGVSTGGPNALAEVFAHLPGDLRAPIVIVQHMPPVFTRLLAERLTGLSPVPCREAEHGDLLEPGKAWLAPGGQHMVLRSTTKGIRVELNEDPPENSCRPAVDPLFRSVASVVGARALGIVLTGMGNDGQRGAQALREAGGHVLAQDEATSVVWGMPGSVVQAGLADVVLPLEQIAPAIAERAARGAGLERRGAA